MHPNGFTSDAINAINAQYYTHPAAFSDQLGLADIYTRNTSLNRAIGSLLETLLPSNKSVVRIKELSAGSHNTKWRYITERLVTRKNVEVILSDFDLAIFGAGTEFKTEAYSLFDQFPVLPDPEKLDAILITYGFDSVWLPDDLSLRKENGSWSRVTFQLQYPDNFNPQNITDIEQIKVMTRLEAVELGDIQYGELIECLYADIPEVWVNVPGGMIKRIVEAFNNQLCHDGVFLIGEVARNKPAQVQEIEPFSTSGRIAKFKIEDYLLMQNILEQEHGLYVKLMTLSEVISHGLSETEIKDAGAEIAPFGFLDLNCFAVISKTRLF
jgi:hypothetical protein